MIWTCTCAPVKVLSGFFFGKEHFSWGNVICLPSSQFLAHPRVRPRCHFTSYGTSLRVASLLHLHDCLSYPVTTTILQNHGQRALQQLHHDHGPSPPDCLPTDLPTNQPTYLPTNQPTHGQRALYNILLCSYGNTRMLSSLHLIDHIAQVSTHMKRFLHRPLTTHNL